MDKGARTAGAKVVLITRQRSSNDLAHRRPGGHRGGMIVRSIEDLKAQGRYQENPGVWTSSRYLLREDDVGFTMTQTTVAAGSSQLMEYKNHIEANLIIEGEGVVLDVATGEEHALKPGTMYTLDKHDRHEIRATTDLRIVCVFTPALVGKETHDEDGSYPIL